MKVEAAVREWVERLPQIEAWIAEAMPIHAVAGAFGGERTREAFTGQPLAWCPSSGQLANWHAMTNELVTRLRKAGYDV
jgi:hypothetical protein